MLVSLRNFRNHKGYSIINLLGLIVGITACLLISLHVIKETSYDKFHPKSSNTYRVVMDMFGKGELRAKSAPTYPATGPALLADLPEVEMYTRILPFGDGVYSVRQPDGTLVRFNEDNAVLADANFFQMFGFELLVGDQETALADPNQIVISESAAQRYFGPTDPLGKTIFWRGTRELKVTGVYADFPENTHMNFDLISSLRSWDGFDEWTNNWGWYDFYTFVKTTNGVSQAALDAKLKDFLVPKKSEFYEQYNAKEELWTQRISDIHLHSVGIGWDMGENGGAQQVYFLSIVAALILVIAWVNYINLATARAIKRAKEVGIRKVVGAQKGNLIFQFLSESLLYNALAVIISVLLVWLLIPRVNGMMEINLDSSLLVGPQVLIGLTTLILLGTLFSGLYPAMVLTSFAPVKVLKGTMYERRKKFGFRQVLVVFQFTASITLILGTFLVVKQLDYMRNQDLGLNIEQTLVLRSPSSGSSTEELQERLGLFKADLLRMPEVHGFTLSNNVPGVENFSISGFRSKHFPDELRNCYRVHTDEHFLSLFDIEFVAGRSFSEEMPTDTGTVILNVMAMKHLGFNSPEEALGEKINPNTPNARTIIGVVKDYHQASLRNEMDPVIFMLNRGLGDYYALKLKTTDYSQVMSEVQSVWDRIYPDNPFDYFFLDEFFDRQYKADEQFNAIFIGFAGLAIFVACLGLFGLISFTAEQSKKEIGIRKVLGASVSKVVLLLAKGYTRLILVAMIIAFPLGYFLMTRWLDGFAYRTSIDVGIFIFGGLLISGIALVTVSFKSFKVANSNPVSALRDE